MKLLVSKLKALNIIQAKTPSEVCEQLCCTGNETIAETCLERKCEDCKHKELNFETFNKEEVTSFFQWRMKSVTVCIRGEPKACKKCVKEEVTCTKEGLFVTFKTMILKYMAHICNISHQYTAMDELKKTLQVNDVLIHMDFSENYMRKYFQEVQSAHFGGSKVQITLHTVVWYYKDPLNGCMVPSSFCTLSESLRHDPAAIVCHLKPLIDEIKSIVPNLQKVHFLSDGPSTQYRNRKMFYLFATHLSRAFQADYMSWNYSESGHGKGAPDGIEGCLKRTADSIVARGKDLSNVSSLMTELKENLKGVTIRLVREDAIAECDKLLPQNILAFKGTMKVHQVSWSKKHNGGKAIYLRRLSCSSCAIGTDCPHYGLGILRIPEYSNLEQTRQLDDDLYNINDPATPPEYRKGNFILVQKNLKYITLEK